MTCRPLPVTLLLVCCSPLAVQAQGPTVAPATAPITAPVADPVTELPVAPGFTRKPRWEFGIGGGYLNGFDYPGSRDPNRRGIALPFFIYRSPVVRVGDGGLRAVALERARFKIDVSFGGGISSSAESGGVRDGLPDLDFLFEVGPRAQLVFANRAMPGGGRWQLSSSAALRYVVATDFSSLDGLGVLGELGLSAVRRRVAGTRFDLIARFNTVVAEDRLHEYYYEVDPTFASATRPAYRAGSGYLGSELFVGAAYRPTPRVRLFAGIGQAFNGGAANRDSPLFETTEATGFAIGFAWTLAQSEDTVSIVDVE